MKLRSVHLTNVRRFAGTTVALDGLGDGLTLVCAPNEAGKSTLFEALQALVFVPHRSAGAEARALRPHSGGAPEAAAEIEQGGRRYRIAKRWLSRPSARVTELPSGRVLAQDDEAEAWIAERIAADGPAELLWVRQGMLALEPDGRGTTDKAEQERLTRIRRDLLSSVATELDAVTGGRRLDTIAARAAAELARLATPSTAKPKKDGPWGRALQEAETLRAEHARLDAQCQDLAAALAERAELREALAAAQDPAAERARAAELTEAERAAAAAREHLSRLDAARSAHRVAALEQKAARDALDAHDRVTERQSEAASTAEACRAACREATEALAVAAARATTAEAAAKAKRAAHAAAHLALEAAQNSARANAAAALAVDLERRLVRATALAREIEQAHAEADAAAVSPADLRAAEAAAADLDRARARMEAGAVSIAMDYLDGIEARLRVDGRPLVPGADHAVTGPVVLDLPGLGRLRITPGGGAASAAREAAEGEATLAALLAPAGAADLAALRALAETRAAAGERVARGEAEIAGLAPQGLAALETELARLREAAAGADAAAPDPDAVAQAEAAARHALDAAERDMTEAREVRLAAAHAEATARERQAAAEAACAAAVAEQAALPERAQLADRLAIRRAAAEAAEREIAAPAAAMPDAEAAEAALVRAKDAVRTAETQLRDLERRDAELGARIATRAEAGVEERRDEAAGRLEAAEARAAACAAEARALTRLAGALDRARAAARERYLAPVVQELTPLLALVLGEAEIQLDPTRLLPVALARDGLEEDLAQLSGGTREQIAILTRLAFARLLARSGRATPVILDDALVYADDTRFAAVLDAIAAVASDVQVIVLTCRERAFAALPAARATLTLVGSEVAVAR
jgi:DNA repair exonuclease SbcCD ATPase subunit